MLLDKVPVKGNCCSDRCKSYCAAAKCSPGAKKSSTVLSNELSVRAKYCI